MLEGTPEAGGRAQVSDQEDWGEGSVRKDCEAVVRGAVGDEKRTHQTQESLVMIRARKQALERIKELQEDIDDAENSILDAKEEIMGCESEIKIIRDMMDKLTDPDKSQLSRLHEIVQKEGTGYERAIVEQAYKGEDLRGYDAERVRALAVQFLGEVVEA